MTESSRVKFALGNQVSPRHFFKSSFARSFVTNCRDSRSLDYGLLNHTTNPEEAETSGDHYYSLVNLETANIANDVSGKDNPETDKPTVQNTSSEHTEEVEKLRKQCQSLVQENERLQKALTYSQIPHVVIDSIFLQTQVDALQWQLKQIEANKQMYRSLMEQVVHFLDRARKSLDILHAKGSHKDKSSAGRVPRSRSAHAVDAETTANRASSASPTSTSSRFTRVKSSAQISYTSNLREFTWSLFRRTDPAHCTPPRRKPQDHHHLNRTYDVGVTYRRPELDPNEIPPEKLSQEAFRLMRTVQSLLSMREPDLARVSSTETSESSPSPVDHHHRDSDAYNDESLNGLQNGLPGSVRYGRRSSCDGENESSSTDNDSRTCFVKTSSKIVTVGANETLQGRLRPGARRSIDATSSNSGSSKTTEEEDLISNSNCCNGSAITDRDGVFSNAPASSSTPNKRDNKVEKKATDKSKPAASVSSVEEESGFSSMSSFQEVGLPNPQPISPIKGCHTEVGLPEVPLGRTRHRKWPSTMAEIQGLLRRQRNSFTTSEATTESLSVWV